jgi:hypothetical protein
MLTLEQQKASAYGLADIYGDGNFIYVAGAYTGTAVYSVNVSGVLTQTDAVDGVGQARGV